MTNKTNPAPMWETMANGVKIGPSLVDPQGVQQEVRGVYCAAAGNAVLEDAKGNTEDFTGLIAGQVYPLRPVQKVSGSATLIALYGD